MYAITRSGPSIASVVASMRDIPARVIPYAAATAMTRSAKLAQVGIREEMQRVFQGPTAYTLNSTYVKTASARDLTARVAIKNVAGNSAIPSEYFVEPQARGGARREKRFERAFRFAGILGRGGYAVASRGSELVDASGNIPAGKITRLISYFGGFQEQGYRANMLPATKAKLARRGLTAKRAGARRYRTINGVEYFVSFGPGERGGRRQHLAAGIYRRRGVHGSDIAPVVSFVYKRPTYRRRLDFEGAAERVVAQAFPAEFARAAAAIQARPRN